VYHITTTATSIATLPTNDINTSTNTTTDTVTITVIIITVSATVTFTVTTTKPASCVRHLCSSISVCS
jgi:hypothetical protein